ncbi:hypothetical protein Q9L58_010250 [Maublancomyces gigas]|uniref:Replication-associated protein n=1 Tax=Discina gigas TaxID=1032678 RepID=A0ABR3G523_9PEZI
MAKILIGNTGAERKRMFEETDEQQDYDQAKKMIKKEDAWAFIKNYNSIKNYLFNEKVRNYMVLPWIIPKAMEDWKRRNIDEPSEGRQNSLLIIGEPKSGKTQWALSFGKPTEMSRKWNMKNYRRDNTHLVVSDAPVKVFGYAGDSYWREVFGCQVSFDGTDKYLEVRKLKWNVPCVWTCNADLDPRKDRVIVNLGDSKLF